MALNSGQRLGTFEIVGPLGSGAMGEVYRARDTRLTREVAIKVLPAEFAEDATRLARFEREAQLLASLNHPGVAQLHQLEETDGIRYLVMELVDGSTLEERILRGPIEVGEALGIFAQIAEAIEAAHEKGIIHRDLKPANIKITTEGRAKVLDFGLAKVFKTDAPEVGPGETMPYDSGGSAEVSRFGQRIGSPAYMSPEQTRGEPSDTASDIWGFGVCLYEALTARRPFNGKTTSDLFAAILKAEPNWGLLPPDTPEHIRSLLRRCLEKEPRRRPRHVGDLAMTLQDTVTGTGSQTSMGASSTSWQAAEKPKRSRSTIYGAALAAFLVAAIIVAIGLYRRGGDTPAGGSSVAGNSTIRSLVVLPFTNVANDAEQEYFVEGMRDALSAELSKIGIRTISRASAMRYKNTEKTPREIAAELGVDALIEGTVLRQGNDIRIIAGLIDGKTDENVWSDTYQDTFENVLDVQGRVALAIAKEIKLTIAPETKQRLTRHRPVDPRLHDIYLQGVFQRQRWDRESADRSIKFFEQAIEIDPNYALGHAGLAETYVSLIDYFFPPYEALPAAKAEALKAVELDDTLVGAHVTLGWVYLFYDWDWDAAEKEFKRALELDPGSARSHIGYALYLTSLLRRDEALVEIRKGLELDPYSSETINWVGMALYMGHQFEFMAERFPKILEVAPELLPAQIWLGLSKSELDQNDEAVELLTRGVEMDRNSLSLAFLGTALARAGDLEKAREIFPQFDELRAQGKFVCPYEVATVYIAMGEYDEAFRWLDLAYETRSDCVPWLLSDIRLDPIREDPRFIDLIEKVEFPTL